MSSGRERMRSAITIFLVSHSMGSIAESYERAIRRDDDRVIADGPDEMVVKTYGNHVAAS